MQDATAQWHCSSFMSAGRLKLQFRQSTLRSLIVAKLVQQDDLQVANGESKEVFDFLSSVSTKYGIGSGDLALELFTR